MNTSIYCRPGEYSCALLIDSCLQFLDVLILVCSLLYTVILKLSFIYYLRGLPFIVNKGYLLNLHTYFLSVIRAFSNFKKQWWWRWRVKVNNNHFNHFVSWLAFLHFSLFIVVVTRLLTATRFRFLQVPISLQRNQISTCSCTDGLQSISVSTTVVLDSYQSYLLLVLTEH